MTGAVKARGRSMPGPGFELSVTAGSPVPHVYLGQQTLGSIQTERIGSPEGNSFGLLNRMMQETTRFSSASFSDRQLSLRNRVQIHIGVSVSM